MSDAIAAAPDRLRGVAVVDDSFTSDDLTALHEAGVRGVRFNFVKHLGGAPDMNVFRRILALAAPLGWHVVLHMDASSIEELTPLMRALTMPFVIDHMGRVPAAQGIDQPAFRALLALARLPNCWVKVSGAERISFPPYDAAVPFARALVETSADRVLWGTDFPHPNPTHEADEADLVDLVPQFAPNPRLQQKLLVDNPARLYGFAPD
jgi:predicted TIM-barrel fold metal-dependent hydrolase